MLDHLFVVFDIYNSTSSKSFCFRLNIDRILIHNNKIISWSLLLLVYILLGLPLQALIPKEAFSNP